jgi:hypothetical protein
LLTFPTAPEHTLQIGSRTQSTHNHLTDTPTSNIQTKPNHHQQFGMTSSNSSSLLSLMAPTIDYANNSATGIVDKSPNPGIKSFLSLIIKSTPSNMNHNDQYESTKDSTPADLAAGDINAPPQHYVSPLTLHPYLGNLKTASLFLILLKVLLTSSIPHPVKNLNGKD